MMRVFFRLTILLMLLGAFQQVKYVKTKVNDDISLLLPEDFIVMSQTDRNEKYVSSRAPIAVYTDYSRAVDLGINIAYSRWNAEDMEIMKSFYKSTIMGLYDEVQFLNESIEEINGNNFAVFEFIASVSDEEGTTFEQRNLSKYIRIQYTIIKSKTVLFNFSCPAVLKDKWAPVAQHMLESVKISKTL